jgi:hypothetical protein
MRKTNSPTAPREMVVAGFVGMAAVVALAAAVGMWIGSML